MELEKSVPRLLLMLMLMLMIAVVGNRRSGGDNGPGEEFCCKKSLVLEMFITT